MNDDCNYVGRCLLEDFGDYEVRNTWLWNSYAQDAWKNAKNRYAWPWLWIALDQPLRKAALTRNPTEAQKLFINWWFETGPESTSYGPEHPETQNLRRLGRVRGVIDTYLKIVHDTGCVQSGVCEHFSRFGLAEHLIEAPGAFNGDMAPFLGSFAIYMQPAIVDGVTKVLVIAYNETTWDSGTRLTNLAGNGQLAQAIFGPYDNSREPRGTRGNGGTIRQTFYWYEDAP
jgi:hypothetical protein